MSNQIVQKTISCSTAKEFLNALSPIGRYFSDAEPNSPWLFRGQGKDKDWPLIPSLFRPAKLEALIGKKIDTYRDLRQAEINILIDFFMLADKRGLTLPDDSRELRIFFENLKKQDHVIEKSAHNGWELTNKAPFSVALAQHYGVPTRFLDWTRQAYIASFFAAESANQLPKDIKKPNDQLVVWAFYFPTFGKSLEYTHSNYSIRVITAPSATNPNLKAQQGVFTQVDVRHTNEETGTYLPLEKILMNLVKDYPETSDIEIFNCRLRKFTLPVSKAPDLLYLLAKFDITPSVVYPGYHSIVSDLQMRKSWE